MTVRSAQALDVRRSGRARDPRRFEYDVDRAVEKRELGLDRRAAMLGKYASDVLEHRAHAARDLHVGCAAGSDLAARDVDEVLPVRRAEDHPRRARVVADDLAAQLVLAQEAQEAMDLVDGEHCRRRIVDRGRQRLEGDVHQDAEREHGILLERALGAQSHGRAKARVVDRGRAAVQREQGIVRGDEVAHLRHDLDHAAMAAGERDQRREVDREHDARFRVVRDVRAGAPSCARSGRRIDHRHPPCARDTPSG